MGPGGPLPDLDDRRRPAARALVARGLQRPALDRAHWRAVALDAPRLAAVVHRVSAGAALAARGRLRGHRARPARGAAPGWRPRGGALGCGAGQPDAAILARARRASGLRWPPAAQGLHSATR